MTATRTVGTKPELMLRRALRDAGIQGYRLNVAALPGRPDVVLPRERIAVFVHGCFWHRCPHCQPNLPKRNAEFWRRKFEANVERDERQRRALEQMGWTVVESWECHLKADPAAVVAQIRREAIPEQ